MKYQKTWRDYQTKNPNKNLCYLILFGWLCVGLSCIFIQLDGLKKDTERRLYFPSYTHNRQEWIDNQFKNAGINPKYAYKIMMCESKGDENATNNNGEYGIDRGLWQINSKYHPEISNSCAYNYKCSTLETIKIVKKSGWKEWVCAQ